MSIISQCESLLIEMPEFAEGNPQTSRDSFDSLRVDDEVTQRAGQVRGWQDRHRSNVRLVALLSLEVFIRNGHFSCGALQENASRHEVRPRETQGRSQFVVVQASVEVRIVNYSSYLQEVLPYAILINTNLTILYLLG